MDNLKEMDKFSEMYNLPKLNREETENMNRPITSNKIKPVILEFPTNKSLRPDGFKGEFINNFRRVNAVLLKLF